MNLNNKMLQYLNNQLEHQDEAIMSLFMLITERCPTDAALLKQISEVMRFTRYIKHAITESQTCEHCKENGFSD